MIFGFRHSDPSTSFRIDRASHEPDKIVRNGFIRGICARLLAGHCACSWCTKRAPAVL